LYRERTNSTTPEIETGQRGALSIKRLEGGREAAAASRATSWLSRNRVVGHNIHRKPLCAAGTRIAQKSAASGKIGKN
jgi:hypothetical protein